LEVTYNFSKFRNKQITYKVQTAKKTMKGFIVYPSYLIINGKTHVQLFGRLENGESFVSINELQPYFFIKSPDLKKAEKYLQKFKVEKTNFTNFESQPVAKISCPHHIELNKLAKALHHLNIDTYESDIKPHFRFMIDNDILGSIEISGDWISSEKINRIYHNPEIKSASFNPKLKIISLDTESDKNTGELYCIGLYGDNYKKNFMVSSEKSQSVICCKDEYDCLMQFKNELMKIDPDIITGWSVINFDLKYLQALFRKHKIPFDIGRTNDNASIRIESSFFRSSSADIPGRLALDALALVKDPFIQEAPSIKNKKFESYTLEDVSQAILGSGKIIKGRDRHKEISALFTGKQHQKLSDYNLMDCELVYNILEKTKIIDLAIERSQLTGMPLDRITASIAAFDSLYIREARKRGLVSPTTRYQEKEERIKGGYVKTPEPGVYKNVLVLDFKSLYPSIIKTFNIDPSSHLKKKEKGAIESPNHAYFRNSQGILPSIIEKLHQAREKAKKEGRELSSYAIKIIQNSFFGVLASPNCRYFSLDMANAITHFGQFIIQLTAKEIEKLGYKVIYMDTDSVFIETKLGKQKANALGMEIEKEINSFYEKLVAENYRRESFLELQFEKQYLSLLFPKIRNPKEELIVSAAKKRYAGLIEKDGEEILEVVGLEAIRGDWTDAAREFQKELLMRLFHDEPPEAFIKEYVKKIRLGQMDEKLIYRKSIRKGLQEYTKTTPPHVKAARLLDSLDSSIIQYYITEAGPEPLQKLKHKIDYEHYIEKQIAPIANQVLSLFSKTFHDLIAQSRQKTLF